MESEELKTPLVRDSIKLTIPPFQYLCLSLTPATPGTQTSSISSLHDKFLDELGRLRVWAGTTGADQIGTESLDYRLRAASHIHQRLVGLLKELDNNIAEGK